MSWLFSQALAEEYLGGLLGWRTVCAVERDAYAAQVLAQRQNDGILKPFPIWSDVRSFDGRPWNGIADVVSGGFPCQDISVAGRGAGISGERSGLWKHMLRIICEVQPAFAWMENSPALTLRGLGVVLGDLAEIGFDAQWGVFSCEQVGGIHRRERIWIKAANTKRKRRQGIEQKQVPKFSRLPWCENIGSVEDLRGRSDLPEPLIRRVNHDVAFGVDRLKAIGNGQVPRVAAAAYASLNQIF
ncbi:DNA cytosine methyltransferase [Chitinibacter bivalviorum]|uniref:DNA cytosine methyltransferase n=1 Tax=Chitinibacter bivalviorum TaxID=2739434 RepID=UPI001C537922|nr:DNA cytosine methyltransferase [Chitinibacter bivalviorum]